MSWQSPLSPFSYSCGSGFKHTGYGDDHQPFNFWSNGRFRSWSWLTCWRWKPKTPRSDIGGVKWLSPFVSLTLSFNKKNRETRRSMFKEDCSCWSNIWRKQNLLLFEVQARETSSNTMIAEDFALHWKWCGTKKRGRLVRSWKSPLAGTRQKYFTLIPDERRLTKQPRWNKQSSTA